jgi:glycosyltransferase involved in cell wall biosynthesis
MGTKKQSYDLYSPVVTHFYNLPHNRLGLLLLKLLIFFRLIVLNPDYVVTIFYESSLPVSLYCLLFNKQYLLRFAGHDEYLLKDVILNENDDKLYELGPIDKMYWLLSYLLLKINIKRNNATVIALHGKMKTNLIKIGINEQKIYIIPNYISGIFFKKITTTTKYTFGFIGRMVYEKGLDLLIEAFNDFNSLNPNSTLLLIGDGDMRKELEIKINNLELHDCVTIKDPVENTCVPYYLSQIGTFILPSRHEGLPNILLQAMASQLPIIVTDVGGVSEVITPNYDGLLICPNNLTSLSNSMLRLDADETLRSNISQNAAKTANLYKIDIITNQYLSLISRNIHSH